MIQIHKEQLLNARAEVRADSIRRLIRDIDDALSEWLQKEKEGTVVNEITISIPSSLNGEVPEEVREELKEGGFCFNAEAGIITIY